MAVNPLVPSHSAAPAPETDSGKGIFTRIKEAAERALGEKTAVPAQPVAPQPTAAPAPPPVACPPAKHELPPGSYDVSQMTKEQLQSLNSSADPKDHRLAATIQRSQVAYADVIKKGGLVIANRSEGNGGNPVVTLLPPGFDANKETRVHTHYHGYNCTAADPPGHGAGLVPRIEAIEERDRQAGKQTVFVIPEASNAPDKGGAYHCDWSHVNSQAATTDEALQAAGVTHPGLKVVSAHSAGGEAISSAMRNHPDGSGLEAGRLELQDCLYGSQSDVKAWSATPSGQAAKQVVYFHGANPEGADAGFAKDFHGRYQVIRVSSPRPQDIPMVTAPDGKQVPAYNANPHDRTNGEYLDSYPDP